MKPELNGLIGIVVRQVAYDDQIYQWEFVLNDHTILYVECHWQIVAEGRVSLGSGDHGQQYGHSSPIDAVARATILLTERKVKSVTVDQSSADLAISFDGQVILRTFNDSSGFEGWQIAGPEGDLLVAQGGGNVVVFPGRGKA